MVGVLFCDQSDAFDLCDHTILLEKLHLMGLEQSAILWMKSYLSGRTQSCFVDGELSKPLKLLECGVPLLWLCFTIDQPDAVVDGKDVHRGCPAQVQDGIGHEVSGEGCGELVGYVDDGAYSYGHNDPQVLSEVLTKKYKQLEHWMVNNKLVINADKTHLMVIGSRRSAKARQLVHMMVGEY